MSEPNTSTINDPRNDDLRIQRDRLVSLLEDTDLEEKRYRKAVESVRKAADTVEKLKAK